MSEVTRILNELKSGSAESNSNLIPAIYRELRGIAAAKISSEKPGQTLNATALVHEAWMRLAGNQSFESRRHFFGAAAAAMRRILIDRARSKNAGKRGADAIQLEIEPDQLICETIKNDKLEALNIALEKFEEIEPEKSELVKIRYFTGLTIREAADLLGISTATADRYWAYAKAWLQIEVESLDR